MQNNTYQTTNFGSATNKEDTKNINMLDTTKAIDWPSMPMLPVAWGEVFDKLTILQIKADKLNDTAKLANVINEREAIEIAVGNMAQFPPELPALIE